MGKSYGGGQSLKTGGWISNRWINIFDSVFRKLPAFSFRPFSFFILLCTYGTVSTCPLYRFKFIVQKFGTFVTISHCPRIYLLGYAIFLQDSKDPKFKYNPAEIMRQKLYTTKNGSQKAVKNSFKWLVKLDFILFFSDNFRGQKTQIELQKNFYCYIDNLESRFWPKVMRWDFNIDFQRRRKTLNLLLNFW